MLLSNTSASVEITDPLVDIEVMKNEGDMVTITCTARGVPPPFISWYLNGQVIVTDGDRVTVVPLSDVMVDIEGYSSVTSMIVISNILRTDAGIGSCVANNTVTIGMIDMDTEATRFVNITVQCKL